MFAAIREVVDHAPVPPLFKGHPIAFITASLMSLAFLGFKGLVWAMNMSISDILIPFLALGLCGAAFAILLSVSYRILAVKGDPKLELFLSILPGSNCGACGHAGLPGVCRDADQGRRRTDRLSRRRKRPVAAKLAEAMGISVKAREELVAFVACRAGRKIREDEVRL